MAFDSILEPKPLPPARPWGRIVAVPIVVLVVAAVLYFQFRNFREEATVKRFFAALTQADYQTAYRIWQPTPSYTLQSFMEDWGPGGPWGRIQTFKILESQRRGDSVVVAVEINRRAEPAEIWVSRKDRSLSFPPY